MLGSRPRDSRTIRLAEERRAASTRRNNRRCRKSQIADMARTDNESDLKRRAVLLMTQRIGAPRWTRSPLPAPSVTARASASTASTAGWRRTGGAFCARADSIAPWTVAMNISAFSPADAAVTSVPLGRRPAGMTPSPVLGEGQGQRAWLGTPPAGSHPACRPPSLGPERPNIRNMPPEASRNSANMPSERSPAFCRCPLGTQSLRGSS
jgi:hypothetical protein